MINDKINVLKIKSLPKKTWLLITHIQKITFRVHLIFENIIGMGPYSGSPPTIVIKK